MLLDDNRICTACWLAEVRAQIVHAFIHICYLSAMVLPSALFSMCMRGRCNGTMFPKHRTNVYQTDNSAAALLRHAAIYAAAAERSTGVEDCSIRVPI